MEGLTGDLLGHEIRTASTAVRGYLKMALAAEPESLGLDQRQQLQEALRAMDRIEGLVTEWLALASTRRPGGLELALKPLRLSPIVEAAVAATHPFFSQRDLQVDLQLESDADSLMGDETRLQELVGNLLANAAKFAPLGTVVRVCSEGVELDDADYLCLVVEDAGPGVREEDAQRIFEPFERACEGPYDGFGLGLALCQRIASAHGGRIEAVAVTHGLFRVLLPRGVQS